MFDRNETKPVADNVVPTLAINEENDLKGAMLPRKVRCGNKLFTSIF